MKFAVVALMLMVAVVFGGVGELGNNPSYFHPLTQDSPTTGPVVFSQPFVNPPLNGLGFSAANLWMMADDFEVTAPAPIGYIEIWAIYATSTCTGMKVEFRANSTNVPGAVIWTQTSTTLTHVNTGFSSWGYPLYYTKIYISSPYYLVPAATRTWLALQSQGGSGAHYWLASAFANYNMNCFSADNGTTWTPSQTQWGTAYDSQFVLMATTGLTHSTWGEIKTVF
jgi:hypothetical protein